VTILLDGFHCIPGADYEQVFDKLAEYAANVVLATHFKMRSDQTIGLTGSDTPTVRGRPVVVHSAVDDGRQPSGRS
jgi:hypothetical protein